MLHMIKFSLTFPKPNRNNLDLVGTGFGGKCKEEDLGLHAIYYHCP